MILSKRLRLGCQVNSETLTRDADSRLVRVVYQAGWKSQGKSEDLTAIQTLQRVGKGKKGGECVRRLGRVKYLEGTQGGNDLAGLLF